MNKICNDIERTHALLILFPMLLMLCIRAICKGWYEASVVYGVGWLIVLYLGKDLWRVMMTRFISDAFPILSMSAFFLVISLIAYFDLNVLFLLVAGIPFYFMAKKSAKKLGPYYKG